MKYIHYITFVTTDNPNREEISNFTSHDLTPTMEDALTEIGKIIPYHTLTKDKFVIGIKNVSTFKL